MEMDHIGRTRRRESLLKLDEKSQTNCENKAKRGGDGELLKIRGSRIPKYAIRNVERITNLRSQIDVGEVRI